MKTLTKLLDRSQRNVLLVLCALAATGASAAVEINESRPAEPEARIELRAVGGHFQVVGHDQPLLELSGRLGDDVEELKLEGDPGHWRIVVEMKKQSGWSWGRKAQTELVLKVPHAASLELSTVSADLDLRGLDGREISLQTVSGDIDIERSRPEALRVKTVSGDLALDGGASRLNRVESVSGDLKLAGLAGQVEVRTVSGDLNLDGSEIDALELQSVSGDLALNVRPNADARIDIGTHSGDVRLKLPRSPGHRVDAKSFSGDFRSGFAEAQRDQRTRRYSFGDASVRIEIESFSGDIAIEPLD